MKLKPLQQWICDKCGHLIEKPSDGWLEWLGEPETFKHGEFKIVHHSNPDTRKAHGGDCYHYTDHLDREDMHLDRFLGLDGMAQLTAWVHTPGVTNLEEWAELFRRLHVPHYEEARQYWQKAEYDGAFAETDPSYIYMQDMLRHVIEEYGQSE